MIRVFLFCLLAWAALPAFGQSSAACYPVLGDQITGKDMQAAVPQLAALSPDLPLGYSPAPGAMRVFRSAQLQQLAEKNAIQAIISDPVCFAWPMRQISHPEITTAIEKSLQGRRAEIQIVDQCRSAAPKGQLFFPLQGLSADSAKPAIWNGYVLYGSNRKFNTWVSVRVTVHEQQIVAVRPIRTGEMIHPTDLKDEVYVGPLRRFLALTKQEEAVGKCARWPIMPGSALVPAMLASPLDVGQEQLVTVHINCGAAHVETQGIAVEGGYRGDIIRIRNPKTGRTFRARIDDRGEVTVVVGGPVGLVVEEKKS